jgi:predicted Zn-dependent protease
MKTKLLISLAVASAVMSGCVTDGATDALKNTNVNRDQVNKAVDTFVPDNGYKQALKGAVEATHTWTPEEEHQLGTNMSAVLLGASPLYKNAQAEKYVNEVGLWIALQTTQPDLPWRFGILDTPNVNAFAAPGGYVFITRGLLLRLHNESELAGVLAHEITHVINHHHANAMKKRGASDVVMGLVQQKSGSANTAALGNLAKGLYSSGLDKSDEYDADRNGVYLAARAGYSAYGLPSVLQMYASTPQDAGLQLLFATHPDPNARLDALGTAMDKTNFPKGVEDAARFKQLQKLVQYEAPAAEMPATAPKKTKKSKKSPA